MATQKLPTFKYHPDPVKTGSIEPSDNECVCCGEVRGYVYVGPVYTEEEPESGICPWCIADGTAAEELGATFTDEAGIGGESGEWDEVDESVIEEVAQRTPGFTGWAQEQWWTHCGDAGQYLGRFGQAELETLGKKVIDDLRESSGLDEDDEEWEEIYEGLDKEGSPTAYLFKCAKCGKYGGYCDQD